MFELFFPLSSLTNHYSNKTFQNSPNLTKRLDQSALGYDCILPLLDDDQILWLQLQTALPGLVLTQQLTRIEQIVADLLIVVDGVLAVLEGSQLPDYVRDLGCGKV